MPSDPQFVIRTFNYRLLPTKRQHEALNKLLGDQRILYNAGLEERIGAYRTTGKGRSLVDQQKSVTEWRKSDEEARCDGCGLVLDRDTAAAKVILGRAVVGPGVASVDSEISGLREISN